ncbi:sensor histidine kinase [Anaerobacillus sp. CMMVII]|uniref:sensor histidine kinase n=1 Tax=Anaerobacillus sp. CMMVII TaxID=2755588 RepID=UPI0021B7299A|nr:sensor histidine kinase [Anaerobacillus sp. CMMVII]MCT8139156.1 sensor histidine kinase [Anaerobacillus sp. CMMVII]
MTWNEQNTKKILLLTTIVVVTMSSIWIALTFYNQKTLNQYNEILQRYLNMNEVTSASQLVIANLNNYMLNPTETTLEQLDRSKEKIEKAKKEIMPLRNEENDFAVTNYINLIDSFIETTDRFILFYSENDTEASAKEFSEATRISTYISEMTLTLLDKELKTYDRFYRGIIEQSKELIKLGIWVLMLITFILLLIAYRISLSITRPVEKLTKAANEFSKGNFENQIKVETNDEIAFLAKTFDRMRININNLILEIKSKAQLEHELQQNKLLLQESQFRSLQSQINPHFLFNTLNTISKKAYLEGSNETGDLLVSVAGLLRYNLKRLDRSVTLQDEVNVLKQYMDIQKARFTDRLRLYLEIDKSCLDVEVPSLTLQPIIENAVIHAVEPSEDGGDIWFRIIDGKETVIVEIADNGKGMDEWKIKQILEESPIQSEGHSTGIGFSNVVKRLRLFYGVEDVITIDSVPGQGTKVTLKIQKQRRRNVC